MEEKELKTKTWQRVAIALIGIIMVGSMLAGYVAIVASGSGTSKTGDTVSEITDAKKAEYQKDYDEKLAKFQEATKAEYAKYIANKSRIKTYDESAANEGEVKTRDLVEGDGKTLEKDDTDYLAFYAGWCADGTIFDSSLNDKENSTAFSKAIDASLGMIEGWNTGVVGMKLGGVREITIPGEYAYGERMEICGGYNKPLKFLVMAVAKEEPLKTLAAELDAAYLRVQYANYGIDYGM
ncbi:FKBP-type peptidyl-prolyl cis-trans isomerase [Candidatus Saccharibacteria bacterium]|nr:FKBP-type peptidyl-prolyl cis-trans isomerase [Candidatus Saccharibacteria bacterium]